MKKTILITGVAGFIGFNLCKKLTKENFNIIGIDNLNSYYDVNLKEARLKELNKINKSFKFFKIDIEDAKNINENGIIEYERIFSSLQDNEIQTFNVQHAMSFFDRTTEPPEAHSSRFGCPSSTPNR